MKIPFDIKFRPQIESGEYKVAIEYDNRTFYARIVCWDFNSTELLACVNYGDKEDVLEYDSSGKHIGKSVRRPDLIIITPEPELSEFEKRFLEIVVEIVEEKDNECPHHLEYAAELLELARKELVDDMQLQFDDEINEAYYRGRKEGKAEALRTRATELTENLVKSGLDKDSIPYHLIEFMCNLYDCRNWKEIEGTAELYVTRIKAAALKDLPRWEDSQFEMDAPCVNYGWLHVGKKMIYILDLEKLPGFKED